MSAAVYWLIIFVILLVFEIATMGLTTIWFAGGALIGALISVFTPNEVVQIVGFLISSVILLVLTRPIAMKFFNKKITKTNAEVIIGTDTMVIETIDALRATGKVRINGIEWSAMASNKDDIYRVDDVVTVEKIQGVKVIVTKKQ